jgi:hypothetical protein
MSILYEDSMKSNEGTSLPSTIQPFLPIPRVKEQKNGILNHPNNIYEKLYPRSIALAEFSIN